jgi:hypothetical protein
LAQIIMVRSTCGRDHARPQMFGQLVPPPTGDDACEDEAYRLWTSNNEASKTLLRTFRETCHRLQVFGERVTAISCPWS